MLQLKQTVAKNITALRTLHKLTQQQLGEQLNYSDKTISKWERAEAFPDIYVLKQMAELFSVTVDYFLHEHSQTEEIIEKAENPQHKVKQRNRALIMAISVLGIYAVATLIYTVMLLCGYGEWRIFIYTVPVAVITLLVLNTLWKGGKGNLYFVSALLWSIIACAYFAMLTNHFWQIFVIGAIPQLIVILCFALRKKH
jgi:transcriptional regulator with XRE-family HTH domain